MVKLASYPLTGLQGPANMFTCGHIYPNINTLTETTHTKNIPCGHMTPASSVWSQLWAPLWVQLKRFVSFPLQFTSSKKISPVPRSKMPLLFAWVIAIASAKSVTEIRNLQWKLFQISHLVSYFAKMIETITTQILMMWDSYVHL